MLSREEVERRLEETDYDLGAPSSWPEMHMEACRCSRCGRWAQIVRPGKYQCECENEPEEKYREREVLQTAQALYDAVATTPLIAAEVERVRRLEAVAEAAKAVDDVMPSAYVPNSEGCMKVWIVVKDAEALRAALAAWREGEG